MLSFGGTFRQQQRKQTRQPLPLLLLLKKKSRIVVFHARHFEVWSTLSVLSVEAEAAAAVLRSGRGVHTCLCMGGMAAFQAAADGVNSQKLPGSARNIFKEMQIEAEGEKYHFCQSSPVWADLAKVPTDVLCSLTLPVHLRKQMQDPAVLCPHAIAHIKYCHCSTVSGSNAKYG